MLKRWGLLVITAATILFTGFILHRAGWFGGRAHAASSVIRTVPRDSLSAATALRQARFQPHHCARLSDGALERSCEPRLGEPPA